MKKSSFILLYSPSYNIRLDHHVFPAQKYEAVYNLICLDPGFTGIDIISPDPVTKEDALLVHSEEYINEFFNLEQTDKTMSSELPLNQFLVDAFLAATGGTVLATQLLNNYNCVFNIGGGFHHSFPGHAEGFCYLNDAAIATKKYLMNFPDHKVLYIDLDVHQGNGNAYIFQDDPNVFTFSMHQENLYPMKQKSKLDVGLPDYCSESEYLKKLTESLKYIELEFKPDLVFYLAGADIFKEDVLGNIQVSKKGVRKRDEIVKEFIEKNNAKSIVLLSGGYARNFQDTVLIHYETARVFGGVS